jgi:A/G-specific adenine glycosylase
MTKKFFSDRIIEWYKENHRALPWRATHNPYHIWLSEIILQQTRVAQGLPYYHAFVNSFPTIHHLAKAPLQQVLRHWQGLGYYSRARNLHKCAQTISQKLKGQFPEKYSELISLPGIGPYTAAAVASFAFREPVAVVDGNVFRVLSRVFGMEEDIATSHGKTNFTKKANELIDVQQPDLFNQGLMEFGALHCAPQNPKCEECIFSKQCIANQKSLQKLLPVKSKKAKIRNRYLFYFIFKWNDQIFMKQRTTKDIWKGLYDFYVVESPKHLSTKKIIQSFNLLKTTSIKSESKKLIHLLSHQRLNIKFIEIEVTKNQHAWLKKLGLKPFRASEVKKLPKPIIIHRYLNALDRLWLV